MSPRDRVRARLSTTEMLDRVPYADRIPVRLFEAAAERDAVAAIDAQTGRSYTYLDLVTRARAVAAVLREAGVVEGDRVAWSAPTGVDAIAVWMGIARLGAIDVGIGDALKGRLLDYVLEDCAPKVVISHHAVQGGIGSLAAERLQRFDAVVTIAAGNGHGRTPNETVVDLAAGPARAGRREAAPELRPEGAATIIYTSGTTGPSKGVMLCHHHQYFSSANLAEQFRIGEGATVYHYSPFNHVSGRQLVVAALLTGSTLIMRERFSPGAFWPDINRYGVTHAITLGSAVPLLMDHDGDGVAHRGSLEYVWASPAMPSVYAEFARRYGVRVLSPYGSTEVGIVVAPGVIPDEPGPPGNSGRASDHFELGIMNDDDRLLPAGEVGEIVVRPKVPWTTFRGYLNREEATLETTRNFWYHSGDLGRIDEKGYLFFVDRKQDFIRTKGENISSSELEQILILHRAVAECAVVPVDSELGDSDVMAVIVPSSGTALDCEEFHAWCAEQVPHFMVPRYIRVADDMPRGQSGKIEKHKLRTAGVVAGTWDASAHGLRATRRGVVRS